MSTRIAKNPPRPVIFRTVRASALALSLLVAASGAVAAPGPGAPAPGASPARDDGLTEAQANQLQLYRHTLLDRSDNPDPTNREIAAGLLIDMGVAPAHDVLAEALASPRAPVVMAVINAMAGHPLPIEALMPVAVDVLRTVPDEARDALIIAVERYGTPARERIEALAQSTELPPPERVGPILALGAFPTTAAGDVLIRLADPEGPEDELVQSTALEALGRLAGLDFGTDYRSWRTWWAQARDQSRDEWARQRIRQLAQRLSTLEQSYDRLTARHVDLLRELYRTLPLEQQLRRLPVDLADALGPVRTFAVQHIERLRRDQEPIPESVQTALATCLRDPLPELRALSARLLNELDYAGIGAHVVEALGAETDPVVLAAHLDILSTRPSDGRVELIAPLLARPGVRRAAASALWSLLPRQTLEPDQLDALRDEVRRARAQTDAPALARLLASVGDESDLAALDAELDVGDAETRRAIAEAYRRRRRAGPLLARASDPAIFPVAVGMLAEPPPSLDALDALAGLRPPDETLVATWLGGLRTLLLTVEPEDLLEADDIVTRRLGSLPELGTLRAAALERAVELPPTVLAADARRTLLERLAAVHLQRDEPRAAWEVLGLLEASDDPGLRGLRFRAAVLAGEFDQAARIESEPVRWVELLEELTGRGSPDALRVRDEIGRRFDGRLAGETKARFDAASEGMTSPPAPADPDDDGAPS